MSEKKREVTFANPKSGVAVRIPGKVEQEASKKPIEHEEHDFSCRVISGKGLVKLLSQQFVECYELPVSPPILGFVTRLDLSKFEYNELIKVRGRLVKDAIYGCRVVKSRAIEKFRRAGKLIVAAQKMKMLGLLARDEAERKEEDITSPVDGMRTRVFRATVLPGRRSVRILNNRVVQCLSEPKTPPIMGVVTRADLNDYLPGEKCNITGLLKDDTIFGAEVYPLEETVIIEEKVEHSKRWNKESKEYVGYVKNRKIKLHIPNNHKFSDVYQQPDHPPIIGFTIRMDLDKYDSQWVKLRAIFERGDIWGAELIEADCEDPTVAHRDRAIDNDEVAAYVHSDRNIPEDARRVLIAVDETLGGASVFDFALQNIVQMKDYVLIYAVTREGDARSVIDAREKSIGQMEQKIKHQVLPYDITRSFVDPKTGICDESNKIHADIIAIGVSKSATPGSVYHDSVCNYLKIHSNANVKLIEV